MLVAKAIVSVHGSFQRSLLGEEDRWDYWAGYVVHLGEDANWRPKPSTLDPMRGTKVLP